jgi:hypothetical protein
LDRQRFVVDRRFWVGDQREKDFETVFAVDGIWQELAVQAGIAEGVVERQEIVGAYYVNEGSDGDLAVPAEN